MFGGIAAVEQLLHGRDEILCHGAADAAVRKLKDIIFGAVFITAALEDFAINPKVAKFIDDQRDAFAICIGKQVADQGRFTASKKAGNDCRRDFLRHLKAPVMGFWSWFLGKVGAGGCQGARPQFLQAG